MNKLNAHFQWYLPELKTIPDVKWEKISENCSMNVRQIHIKNGGYVELEGYFYDEHDPLVITLNALDILELADEIRERMDERNNS